MSLAMHKVIEVLPHANTSRGKQDPAGLTVGNVCSCFVFCDDVRLHSKTQILNKAQIYSQMLRRSSNHG